jgi:putative transport protein
MRAFFESNPLLLLFVVTALGYVLGTVRLAGFSLGVAAVLFAGLLLGWLLPGATLPDFVPQLGLVLFVYTIGIASGPGFFASLKRRGLRDNGLALLALLGAWAVALFLGRALGLRGAAVAGVFAGGLNNAPALAAASETLRATGASATAVGEAVLAFSVTYPLGVLLPLLAVTASARFFHVTFSQERISLAYGGNSHGPLINATVCVDHAATRTVHELKRTPSGVVQFGRLKRSGLTSIVQGDTLLQEGDLVTVVGPTSGVNAIAQSLGHIAAEHLELERSEITFRRIFVSNPAVTELPLRELSLPERCGAVITRVRRGDVDLTPDADFELLLGDRARVVAPLDRMPELTKLLGDSARRVAEVDLITFGLGIALGLLLGAISVPLPGGAHFALGSAGGPLVMGLILGRLGRTGPLVWTPPYSANMTLRQLGLVLFLAGVGLKAGASLAHPGSASGWPMLLAGAAVTCVAVLLSLFVGYRLLKIPLAVLVGTMAGIQTQPAVLAFAVEKTELELPNVGYASVFPVAMIGKIVLTQLALQMIPWH